MINKTIKNIDRHKPQSSHGKAPENRWVFSLVLKLKMEGAILISSGREFHNRGPATEKARSSLRLSRTRGTTNIAWSDERILLIGEVQIGREEQCYGKTYRQRVKC